MHTTVRMSLHPAGEWGLLLKESCLSNVYIIKKEKKKERGIPWNAKKRKAVIERTMSSHCELISTLPTDQLLAVHKRNLKVAI